MLPSGTSVTVLFQKQKGNALFLILIAVALFAALSYAVTKSTRGTGSITKEKAILDSGLAQQCIATVERAANMLRLVGRCPDDQISYELPDGTNENPTNPSDKSCFVFDKLGGDTTPCGAWLSSLCSASAMLALNVGEKCAGADIVYAGISGGHRIYTTSADQGSTTWNNGSGIWEYTPATSASDGLANTNALLALSNTSSPYKAAVACRTLGTDWYLPAKDELNLLYQVRHTGALNNTFVENMTYQAGAYWASTEWDDGWADNEYFTSGPGSGYQEAYMKWTSAFFRCVRRD